MEEKGPVVGEKAPDFTLPEASEQMMNLADMVKKGTVVLVFYPTDYGITCTLQFKKLNEMAPDFEKAKAMVLGISVSSTRSHRAWKENHNLNILLLSDFDTKVAQAYHVMSPEDSLLKGHSNRAIFIVDRDQIVRYRWEAPDSHTQPDYEVLLRKVQDLSDAR